MGHASMRAALIYQHATSERDREIADSIDKRISKAQGRSRRGHAPRPQRPAEGGGDSDDGAVLARAR